MRKQILSEKLVDPIARGGIVARVASEGFVTLVEQQREVAVATIDAAAFVKDAKIDDATVKAFYEANQAAFRTPEEAKFEYVVLTPDALLSQVTVTPEEVKAQYANNVKQYTKDEQRDAAHILIAVKPAAKEADKAAAKKKAEDIYAQAKANPVEIRRPRAGSIRRTRARPRRAAISAATRAARWSRRSRTPSSR